MTAPSQSLSPGSPTTELDRLSQGPSEPLDVTGRKKTEEQLRKLSLAVQFSPSMIFITDREGRVEYVNPAWEKITGYRLDEVVGQRAGKLKSGVHPPEFYEHLWKEITAGRIWRGEFCNRKKSGDLYWESAAIAPVLDDAGTIRHFVAIKEDITARKLAAHELRLAKEAAETANRAKSAFLANMSHEIRTPMNIILGYAQLLLRNPDLTASERQRLIAITRSGEHLLDIIGDILEIARIESGKATLSLSSVDLHLMLEDLTQVFRSRAQAKGLAFVFQRDPGVPRNVQTDATKLRQVLIHILSNAVKFTAAGHVTLRVSGHPEPNGTVRLVAEVEDTGPGIPTEEIVHLFEPFYRGQNIKHMPGGAGLGLPISQEFVHLMGGTLTATSQIDQGSIFRIELRVQATEPTSVSGTAASTKRVLHLSPDHFGCRVLAVDDELSNLELVQQLLEPIGFDVLTATEGAEAVALCDREPIQAVLMDIRMPGMDGCEAIQRIRAGHPDLPIIAISAGVLSEDQGRALNSGANAFLTKPVREPDLLEQLRRLTGVDYLHGMSPPLNEPAEPQTLPSADALEHLPSPFRAQLRRALEEADYEDLLSLLDRAAEHDADLAAQLRPWIERFEYEPILRLLGEA